jgi:molecular chaperone Hsp33
VPLDGGQLYRSIVPLQSGEIGDDLTHFLVSSEQAPAAVGVGVWVEPDGTVGAAGGWLVQALPGADPDVLDRLADRIERLPSPTALIREGADAEGILAAVLGDVAQPALDARDVRFRCRCSPERVRGAILAMGQAEIADVLANEKRVDATCEFCGMRWAVDEAALRALLG